MYNGLWYSFESEMCAFMSILSGIREKKMRPKLNEEINFYNSTEISKISNYQISKFNKLWQNIQVNVPFYKSLVSQKVVPKDILSFDDFKMFPIIDRSYVQENINKFTNSIKKPDTWVTTGGSTGTPLNYPSWKSETQEYESSVWYARNFYNINRSDRMFRLWGHSHTLGSGFSKYKNTFALKIGLPLIGYKRFPAYDLSDDKLREAGKEIIKFKPKYIIGYSKALYMLARVNKDKKNQFHQLNLKAVIGAAEGFEKDKDRDFIQEVFGCPVGLEYASMETKLLAHTHPDGGYKIIWRNNLVECVDDENNPSNSGRILVTSLYDRAFPLIRYELGDIIVNTKNSKDSVYAFGEVQGRDNDFLMLDENTPLHSEAITHAIKFSDKVVAYQIRYTKDNKYTIYVKSNEKLLDRDFQEIKKRLKKVDTRLNTIEIKQADQLKQTIAGKTNWLMKE